MNIKSFNQQAQMAADFLKNIANPVRLQILCLLIEHEQSVGNMLEKIQISQSALSQHLARLRHEEVVDFRRDGQTLYYSIKDAKVRRVMQTLHELYC